MNLAAFAGACGPISSSWTRSFNSLAYCAMVIGSPRPNWRVPHGGSRGRRAFFRYLLFT
ncbi:hypothetical protein AHiyo1_07590 [Arthrobacter sp. Hiyo1]|nr:hypothetical protein AHiyo1_07590 [Arthrobacter sp. Hiyo1]